jgi:hypothetical protein
MARALFAVGGLLALLIAGLVLVAWLGRADESLAVDNILSEQITSAVTTADQQDSNLVLADVNQSPWDKVVVVSPRTSREEISRRIGSDWKGDVGYDAGELFIFLRGGEVDRFAHYLGKARFEGLSRPFDEFTPESAVFVVQDGVVVPRDHPHAGGGH